MQAQLRPIPRVAAGAAAVRGDLRCGIDVSDGLVQDLGHVADASGVGIVVQASKVPLSDALKAVWPDQALELALGGGEDYELVVIGHRAAVERYAATLENGATVIGEVVSADKPFVRVLDDAGDEIELARKGWDHLTAP